MAIYQQINEWRSWILGRPGESSRGDGAIGGAKFCRQNNWIQICGEAGADLRSAAARPARKSKEDPTFDLDAARARGDAVTPVNFRRRKDIEEGE